MKMNENLALNLVDTASAHGGRPAVRHGAMVVTYARLADLSARASRFLRERGTSPGERVGLMLPNLPEFAVGMYGALHAGTIAVPMNVMLKRREVAFQLRDSGTRLLLAGQGCAEEAEAGAREVGAECVVVAPGEGLAELVGDVDPEAQMAEQRGADTAVILYTSGTTGQPKGAELSHANLRSNADVFRGVLDLKSDDVVFGALPLFHSFGQTCGLHTSIVAGACLSLLPRFEPRAALELIQRDHVTVFEGVPTMYAAMLHHPQHGEFQLPSLRLCVSGGASLPLEIMRGFEAAFGCPILEGYGLSETAPVASFNQRDRPRKPGSIGTPLEGVEMRLVDDSGGPVRLGEVGEIMVRGPNVMKGYWRHPAATAEALTPDGWLHTGDLARIDEDGFFFIVDRKKDMIIRGGYNVYGRRWRRCSTSTPRCASAQLFACPIRNWARRWGRRSCFNRAAPRRRPSCASSSGSGLPPTSTLGWSGSSVSCPRMPRARC